MIRAGRRDVLTGLAAGLVAAPALALAEPAPIRIDPDRELMVPVEGGQVYVRINGDLQAPRPPLIYAHGGPGGGHAGLLPLTALADERAVILWDQLDSGRSDAPLDPRNWRVERFVDEFDRIRDALGIARWHVGGGSWGGTMALEYGARQRPGTASLILQSPLVATKRWLADAAILRAEMPAQWRATLSACETAASPAIAQCDLATDAYYAAHVVRSRTPAVIADYRAAHPARAGHDLYQRMWGSSEFVSTGTLRSYDGEPLLARLPGARTLFACGEWDEARPATIGDYARRVPGASFRVIRGAAHALTIDQPDAYLALLRRWMARHDAA
ncbi:proline iminopeptidase-family hydrolase [uncultured Sphingomonas sp.]|uniref:proline iminopeptidase-family hydrolase n=1 Tax=uncultured Sphingomonas sp. TaxID=158754 RepID=UPI0025DD9200|nr:proline iminopeptidase-family hydrolase [uncultured Sphingomonas sp.]